MSSAREGLARSLQAKLSQHAKRIGADPNLVLTRYAVERYLYRLSRSAHTEKFVLKGARLMFAWMGTRSAQHAMQTCLASVTYHLNPWPRSSQRSVRCRWNPTR